MKKKEVNYTFKKIRNYKLITPCCNSLNKDGKFANYNELSENYGYCHSCGKTTLPPKIYLDDCINEFIWNETLRKYDHFKSVTTPTTNQQQKTNVVKPKPKQLFIDEQIIWKNYMNPNENNLIKYLKSNYPVEKVYNSIYDYVLGTTNDGGTVFWQINKDLQVQKNKVCYYKSNGKRTNRFIVNYRNDDGYYSCLFGEHLLTKYKNLQKIILVESEKTAIVGSINLPSYTWLAYGGLTQLTQNKIKVLEGYTVLIIPDISNKAVNQINKKLPLYRSLGINISIWDLTGGASDEKLNKQGVYNCDLEDIFRKIKSVKLNNAVL